MTIVIFSSDAVVRRGLKEEYSTVHNKAGFCIEFHRYLKGFSPKKLGKYFSNQHKISFCEWIFKNPDPI